MLARTLDTVMQLERRHSVTVVLGADAELLEPMVRNVSAPCLHPITRRHGQFHSRGWRTRRLMHVEH